MTDTRLLQATALALTLAAGAATAQEATQAAPTEGADTQAPTETQQAQPADALVATVGDAEIMTSDVRAAIGALPAQMRSQPPEMLVPFAIEQLVLRELIYQAAQAENLGEDPEVVALVEEAGQAAEQDAMVQVWLQRELDAAVTDETVQQTYDQLQTGSDAELPPLEELRPQIEQQLRRQTVEDLRTGLQDDVRVMFYGPDGQPLAAEPAATGGGDTADQNGADAGGADQGGAEMDGDTTGRSQ
ncbi:hypothetical protein [Tranquillimonas alkanivorans]|uniref:Uncharacterized protein n=1 Tax=Tranquillimonas alkanivorans TaxID=441119 RepID=A0A1I5NT16_9RHOB|nr:hypothetical protein [Tranquillimonas alkanivorans]SFP24934.1 hypothetical protein SAMN04488047_10467 [Tranquillimonas alkanivorans]